MPQSYNERRLKELERLIRKKETLHIVLEFIQLAIIVTLFFTVLYLAFDINY